MISANQRTLGSKGAKVISLVSHFIQGTRFVNNKEMADIIFNIEGEQFFAHKIILQNASRRLEVRR